MSKLERWLPFKFRRKDGDEKKSDTSGQAARALAPMFPTDMRQMMQQMFDEPLFSAPFSAFGDLDRWFGDFSPGKFSPNIDVVDEENTVKVTAELPGMSKDDVELTFDERSLTISGKKENREETKENGVFRTERYYGYVQRTVPLPGDLDRENAEASFENGVLSVRFKKTAPKTEEKRIPVK